MPYVLGPRQNVFPSVRGAQEARQRHLQNQLLQEEVETRPYRDEKRRLTNLLTGEQIATHQQEMDTRAQTERLQRWKTGLSVLGSVENKGEYMKAHQFLRKLYPDYYQEDFGDWPHGDLLDEIAEGETFDWEDFRNEMNTFSESLSGPGTTVKNLEKYTLYNKKTGDTKVIWKKKGEDYTPEAGWTLQDKEAKPGSGMTKYTLYNVENPSQTRVEWRASGEDFTPPKGWTLNKPSAKKTTTKEPKFSDLKQLTAMIDDAGGAPVSEERLQEYQAMAKAAGVELEYQPASELEEGKPGWIKKAAQQTGGVAKAAWQWAWSGQQEDPSMAGMYVITGYKGKAKGTGEDPLELES